MVGRHTGKVVEEAGMLFVKSAIILLCVLAVLIPISIFVMLKHPGKFDNVRKMVQQQYPSLFHREPRNNNGYE